MTRLTVRPVEPHECDTWDVFVSRSPQGTLFHTSAWCRALAQSVAPDQPVMMACFDDKTIVGGCVFVERERFGMQTAVTPLLTPYSGFLLDGPSGEKLSDQVARDNAVLESLIQTLEARYAYLSFVLSPHLEDIRPLQQAGFQISPRFTYRLNLRLDPEEHWRRFDGSARRQIKKAERVEFEICERLPVEPAYQLFVETFRRHGEECPVAPEFFQAIATHEALTDHRHVMAAWSGDRLVAYVILLSFNKQLFYAVAATHLDYLSTGVSSLLVWEIVKQFSGRDWNFFDFVGANIPSIARFKENFNPRLQLYFHVERYRTPYVKLGRELLKRLQR